LKQKVLITKAHPGEPLARAREDARPLELLEREELRDAHGQQPDQHGEEADRVYEEADACAGDEHDTRHRRPEDPRSVEQRRVEADRVRQILASNHPVRELLARRHVEDEHRPVQEGDHVEHPRLRKAAERDPGECRGEDELRGLRRDHRAAGVEPVGEDAGEQAERHVRHELRERHHANVER
jgi:hypothetical protein